MSIKSIKQIYDLTKTNDGNIYIDDKQNDVYRLSSNNSIDDIKLPENLEINQMEIRYDDGEGMQLQIVDKETKKPVGVLNCKKPHELLKRAELTQKIRTEERLKKELEEAKKLEAEVQRKEELKAQWNNAKNAYYENYIDYLHKHNANKDIIELEAIKDIMMDIIKRADQVNLANGRTPFSYSDVREDGTFDIKGRTSGFTANEIYKISYTDDISGETYIKIDKTIEDPMSLEEPETKTIYVNKDGEIVNTKNKETIK